jgi:hypothetical protein
LKTAILSSTYFGPVQWYQKLNRNEECLIEQHDNFIKQTYRNRCNIATTQGLQSLSIPVSVPDGAMLSKTEMKDILISDHANWRHVHWNALCSAYGDSPFFEFYQDDIRPFYEKKWKYLLDFNMEITGKMVELLDIQPHIRLTDEYSAVYNDDFRDVIRPKHPLDDSDFHPKRYYQVYEQKLGFMPNLSILDLLFNEGNESVFFL